MDARIAFIGGGNMARSLAGGLVADGTDASRITVGEPDASRREALHDAIGVAVTGDNATAVEGAGVVVFAVKPQVIAGVARDLAPALPAGCLVISIAAGIRSDALSRWLGGHGALVRAMPNTPALLRGGITALYAGAGVDDGQRGTAESVMRAVGKTLWIEDESLMDAVTAVSGSGPAYLFLLVEALEAAAREQGLDGDTAHALAVETALGAARMAVESGARPAELREQVTSPGGTTEAALAVLEQGGLRALVARAVSAATRRGAELADAEDGG